MTVEMADADVSCLMEERGPTTLLNRYGVTMDDIEYLAFISGDDLVKQAVLLHGLLLGLSMAETRERETA